MENYNFRLKTRQIKYFTKTRIVLLTVTFFLILAFSFGITYLIKLSSKYEACKAKRLNNNDSFSISNYSNCEHVISTRTDKLTMTINMNENRLPKNLLPYYYQLFFIANFNDEIEPIDYTGTVLIFFKCINVTNKLILNVMNLEIDETSIIMEGITDTNIKFSINKISINRDKELLIIENGENFKNNHNYTVYIQFKGFLKDDDIGLFRLSYFDKFRNRKY